MQDNAPRYTERMNRVNNPTRRFETAEIEWDEGEAPVARLKLIDDRSASLLSKNDSPDIGFTWSVNPYRGCTHACAYCYARAFHEFLDLGAGSDFERVLHVKREAPALLEAAFDKRSWQGELVCFSGVTDCYQPIERRFGLTRACLEVCARYRNPVGIITRSPLIARDIDVLQELAAHRAVWVTFSLPIPDPALCRLIEPGAAPPSARLEAIARLSEAGIPVGVSVAPIIPGLNDSMAPEALRLARQAGASSAWTSLVRLSPSVAAVFEARLREALPDRADRVMAALHRARSGALGGRGLGDRMRGDDKAWEATERLFRLQAERLGYGPPPPLPSPSPFRRPHKGPQLGLFG